MTSYVSKLAGSRNLSVALAVSVVGLVIGGEYFFRHYVLFWVPTIGTLLVNDMSLFLVYLLLTVFLGSFMQDNWRQELADVVQSLREGFGKLEFHILGNGISVKRLGPIHGGSVAMGKHQPAYDCQYVSELDGMVVGVVRK